MNGIVAWALLALALATGAALGANDHDANDTDTATTADSSPEATTLLGVNEKVCNVTWDTEIGDQLKITWTGDLDGHSPVYIETTRICSTGLSCNESKQNLTTPFSTGFVAFPVEPDSEYRVKVDFQCPVADVSRTVRSPPAILSVPRNLRVVSKSNTSVGLIWDVANPPEGSDFWYVVELRNASIEGTVDTGNSTWFTITHLAPYTNYTFRVRIETERGEEGKWSEEVTARTEVGVPHPPRALKAVEVTSTTISLEWLEPQPSTGPITMYRIRWKNATQDGEIKVGKSLFFKVDGLTPDANYTFNVLAVTKAGPGEWSEELGVHTDAEELSVPRNLRVVSKSNTSVGLIWDVANPPEGLDFWYIVELRNASIEGTVDTGNNTWFTITHLAPYTNYTFRVHIETEKGEEGKWSEEVTARTGVGVPYAPRALKAVEITNTTITLEWLEPQPSTGPITMYRIRWRNATQDGEIKVGKSLNFKVDGLIPDASYTFEVLAVTKAGPGEWSEELEVQTEGVGLPVPTNLRVITKSNTSVELGWNVTHEPETPFLYIVEMKNASIDGTVDTEDNSTQFTITDLAPYSNYTFRVRIELLPTETEGAQEGDWSDELVVQTDVGVPYAPRGLKVQKVTNTAVAMEWQEPKPSTGPVSMYRISWRSNSSEGELDCDNKLYGTVGGLAPYVEYSFRVVAITDAGPGQWSKELLVQTDVGVPPAPTALEAVAVSNTSVSLRWTEPKPSTGPIEKYRISWMKQDPKGVPNVKGDEKGEVDTADNGTSGTVPGLTPSTKYAFKVLAFTRAGRGGWSKGLVVSTKIGVPRAPTDLRAGEVSNTTVSLSWTQPDASTGPILRYRLHWKNASKEGERDTSSTATSFTVDGLVPHVQYAFRVLAVTEAGPGPWSEVLNVTTKIGVPYAPTDFQAESVGNTTVRLSWKEPGISTGPILSYRVHWKSADVDKEISTWPNDTSCTVDKLSPYTDYAFKVQAETEAGPGPWSEKLEVRTKIGVPPAPVALRAESVGNTSVQLKWDDPKMTTGPILMYRIHWSNSSSESEIKDVNTTSYALKFLAPFTRYTFKVLAVTEAGPGRWSKTLEVRTKFGVPPAPVALRAESVGNTSVQLKWDDPKMTAGPILMYRIHWSNSSSEGEIRDVNATSYALKFLAPFTRYTFKVLAVTEAGPGRWSKTLEVWTKVGVPYAPADFQAESVGNTTVRLKWKEPRISTGPILSYRVHWKSVDVDKEISTWTNDTTSYTVDKLSPYTDYAFKVQAETEAGPGQWSEKLEVRTKIGVPPAPASIRITSLSNTTVSLAWEAPRGPSAGPILRYIVSWERASGVGGELDTRGNGTSFTVRGLAPHTKHAFRVRAATEAGAGNWSDTLMVRTDVGVPYPPTALAQSDLSNTSVTLTWTEPGISTGPILKYRIQWENSSSSGEVDPGSASTSYTLEHLTPYEKYSFKVRACTSAGYGEWSGKLTIQTKIGVPTAPGNLLLDRATDVSLQISWTRPLHPRAPSLEYVIIWRQSAEEEDANETEIVIHGDIAREVSRHAITDLLPYTNYSVRVSAITTAGMGASTPLLEVATLVGVPKPASIRNVVVVREGAVRVDWSTEGPWPGPVGFSLQAWKYPDPCSGRVSPTVDAEVKGGRGAGEWRGGEQSTVVEGLCPHCNYSFVLLLKTVATDGVKSRKSDIVQMPPEASSEPRNVTSLCNWSSTQAIVRWIPPLKPNGKITNYRIWYGIEGASDIKSAIVDAVGVCDHPHRHVISHMRPEKRYIITVTATVQGVMEDGKAGYARGICILPAGIPLLGDTSRLLAKSSSPGLVVLEWTRDAFSEEMGAIVLYAVLVGKKGALGSSEAGKEAQSFPTWSNFSSGFSDFYQATPLDWNPFTLGENDPLACEISSIKEENNRTLLRCFIGIQKHCPENITFCNGPLEPDTTYEIKIRGYTKGGYNETQLMIVKTGLVPKDSLIPMVVAVVVVLVLLGSLTAGCFVMKKKGLLAPLADTFRTRLGPPKVVAACGDLGVEMQKGKTNRCIKAKHFAEHVRLMMSDSHLQFSQEFEALKKDSPQHPCTLAETEENRMKNRWMNIFPFDHSRVKLLPLCDEPASDFINANYIPGYSSPREYIATQGPLPHTLEDFWRMVWEQAVTTIVMLTQCVERGKKKCEQYWPNPGEYQYFGDLVVATLSESMLSSYVIRILHVQLGSYERQVKQMHFTHWPDFGCPQSPEDLINFVNAVRDHLPRTAPGPILVHCSAGVGRTGTFIAVDRLARKLLNAPLYGEDTIDVYGTVLELRNHRTNMVQTEDQYIYIHLCVSRLIRERDRPYPRGENIYSNMGIEKDTPL